MHKGAKYSEEPLDSTHLFSKTYTAVSSSKESLLQLEIFVEKGIHRQSRYKVMNNMHEVRAERCNVVT